MEWGADDRGAAAQRRGSLPEGGHRFRTQEEYNAYLRVANESLEVGKETLSALAGQSEALDRATTVAAASQYHIDRSARVLRGMTWWGTIQNWFSDEPAAPRPHKAAWLEQERREEMRRRYGMEERQDDSGRRSAGEAAMASSDFRAGSFASLTDDAIRAKAQGAQPVPAYYHSKSTGAAPDGLTAKQRQERDELFLLSRPRSARQASQDKTTAAATPQSLLEVKRVQDSHLSQLSGLIDEQRRIGTTLKSALVEQTMQIHDLEERTDRLHDSTRAVVRKAARLSQGSWTDKPKFLANVALREVKSGLFVAVRGDELRVLEPALCKPCKFSAYLCQANITGLQSALSHRWVGQTLLGDLRVRGSQLGRNESFELDWSQAGCTFLMSYSANWGSGGYVTVGPEGKLTIGGYSAKDKQAAARFEVVDCDEYTDSSLVNEVLVKQPPPLMGKDGAGGRAGK